MENGRRRSLKGDFYVDDGKIAEKMRRQIKIVA